MELHNGTEAASAAFFGCVIVPGLQEYYFICASFFVCSFQHYPDQGGVGSLRWGYGEKRRMWISCSFFDRNGA